MTSQTIESKSMRNAKNIYWNDKRNAYIVYLQRYGQVFYKLSYSLEDAIELRDKVLEFFKTYKRKPTSDELNLSRRQHRYAKSPESKSVECKMCGNLIDHYTSKERKTFFERDCKCGYCYRIASSDKEVIEDPDSMKHISFDKSTDRYIVQINRSNERFHLRTDSLEEAKRVRNVVIQFRIDNDRLPSREEKIELFSMRTKSSNSSKFDPVSKDSTKHISKRGDGSYTIQIFRNCKFYRSSAPTLERAIEIRDHALEYFDRFGVLPTAKQLTEYLN